MHKPNTTDGLIYIMFYPNQNTANTFTTGYQLFAGISVYKGTQVLRPFCANAEGSAIAQCAGSSITKDQLLFTGYIEY